MLTGLFLAIMRGNAATSPPQNTPAVLVRIDCVWEITDKWGAMERTVTNVKIIHRADQKCSGSFIISTLFLFHCDTVGSVKPWIMTTWTSLKAQVTSWPCRRVQLYSAASQKLWVGSDACWQKETESMKVSNKKLHFWVVIQKTVWHRHKKMGICWKYLSAVQKR